MSTDSKTAQGPGIRNTTLVHQPCKIEAAAEKLDANGDGKPDVHIVKEGGRTVCYAVDLNFDGKVDEWVYLDSNGKARRREFALSIEPDVNKIEIYKNGELVEVDKSTIVPGRLDTWQFYQAGRPTRGERDSNGDGRVDEWWDYQGGNKADCPTMYSDANGDGKPDPGSQVNLCGGGYVPPERTAPQKAKSPSFERPGAIPTETENKAETTGDKPAGTPGVPSGKSPAGADSSSVASGQAGPTAPATSSKGK